MRAKIYEKASEKERTFFEVLVSKIHIPSPRLQLSIARKYSFIEHLKNTLTKGIQELKDIILKWGMILGGGVVALMIIIPIYSYITVQPSIAYQASYLRNIENTIAISRFNETIAPEENYEIMSGDIISTGSDSSVEIIFFEGSNIRLDTDTQIKINVISPHPHLFSQGGIEVELISGQVWGKTFQSPTQSSYFTVASKNITAVPIKAGFSLENKKGKEVLQVFENSVHAELRGINVDDNMKVLAGEMIAFTPFDEFRPLNEIISEMNPWIEKNLTKDALYTNEYLQTVSKKLKEQYVLEEVSERMNTFLEENPDPDAVQKMISDINTLLIPQNIAGIESQDQNEILGEISLENDVINIEKTYYPVQTKTYSQRYTAPVVYNKTATPIPSQENTEMDNNDVSPPLIQENEIESVIEKDSFELYAEKREGERQELIQKAAENFSEQVDAFSFAESRNTQAENILKKIPDTAESIELLEEIEKNAPRDVKRIVKQKRIELAKEKNIETPAEVQSVYEGEIKNELIDIESEPILYQDTPSILKPIHGIEKTDEIQLHVMSEIIPTPKAATSPVISPIAPIETPTPTSITIQNKVEDTMTVKTSE